MILTMACTLQYLLVTSGIASRLNFVKVDGSSCIQVRVLRLLIFLCREFSQDGNILVKASGVIDLSFFFQILAGVMSPALEPHTRWFLRELLRQSRYSTLFWICRLFARGDEVCTNLLTVLFFDQLRCGLSDTLTVGFNNLSPILTIYK